MPTIVNSTNYSLESRYIGSCINCVLGTVASQHWCLNSSLDIDRLVAAVCFNVNPNIGISLDVRYTCVLPICDVKHEFTSYLIIVSAPKQSAIIFFFVNAITVPQ